MLQRTSYLAKHHSRPMIQSSRHTLATQRRCQPPSSQAPAQPPSASSTPPQHPEACSHRAQIQRSPPIIIRHSQRALQLQPGPVLLTSRAAPSLSQLSSKLYLARPHPNCIFTYSSSIPAIYRDADNRGPSPPAETLRPSTPAYNTRLAPTSSTPRCQTPLLPAL